MSVPKTLVFQGKIVDLLLERVQLPNGQQAELEIVQHPGGAAVVALDAQKQVCLLRQYRPVVGAWLWELPAGKIDDREDPLVTARRELREEAGMQAQRWEALGQMYSSPGICTEVVYLYLAQDLTPVPTQQEALEIMEIHWIPWKEALAWCQDGTITDAKTLIGLRQTAVRFL